MKVFILLLVMAAMGSSAFAHDCGEDAVAAAFTAAKRDIPGLQAAGIKPYRPNLQDEKGSYYLIQIFSFAQNSKGELLEDQTTDKTNDYKVYVNPKDPRCRMTVIYVGETPK